MNKTILIGAALTSALGLAACNQTNPAGASGGNASTQTSSLVGNSSGTAGNASSANSAAAAGGKDAESGAQAPTAQVTAGDATNQNFTLNNRSQETVTHVYVSRVSDERWGEDVLGSSQVVAPGGSAQITFPRGENECNWDVRVTVNNNQNHEMRNLNLCETGEVNYN